MSFSKSSLDFLFQNRINDSKPWFLEHKNEYNELVLKPLCELVTALEPAVHEIDKYLICEPKVGRSVSRIYRDVRFSNDKSVFRDVMWCTFMRDKKLYHGVPAFFFEVSPVGFRYGCGYYQASVESMDAMRQLILDGDRDFLSAIKAFKKQSVFHLEDVKYKRTKFPDQPDELREWLDQKSVCLIANSGDFDMLFSDGLAKKLADDYRSIKPIYDFLMKSESMVLKK